MKQSILFISLMLVVIFTSVAQEKSFNPIAKGNWLIEANTGFGNIQPANTGLFFKVSNGKTLWNVGGEAGFFIADGLAVKLGLGYGNLATGASNFGEGSEGGGEGSEGGGLGEAGERGSGLGEAAEGGEGGGSVGSGGAAIAGLGSILSYKVGLKYYLLEKFPLQVDFSGTSVSNYNYEVGFQAGYALFLGEKKNVSIEPGIRYSIPLSNKVGTIDDQFQFNVGFAYHF